MLSVLRLALAAPSITLSPPQGPPTTKVDVSGTGYGANAAVDIYFDTTDVCLAIASDTGGIGCRINVPREAQPHAHWISAIERGTNTGRRRRSRCARTGPVSRTGRQAYRLQSLREHDHHCECEPARYPVAGTDRHIGNSDHAGGVGRQRLYRRSRCQSLCLQGRDGNPRSRFSYDAWRAGGDKFAGAWPGKCDIASDAPDRKLYAFKAATGATVPGFPVTLAGNCRSPAFYNGNVYIAALGTDKIYAFDAATGATIANFPVTTPAGVTTEVSAANGRIYAGVGSGLFAFDTVTGAVVPGYPRVTGGPIFSTPALNSGQVFFGNNSGLLYGLRASDGESLVGFSGGDQQHREKQPGGRRAEGWSLERMTARFTASRFAMAPCCGPKRLMRAQVAP